MKKLVLCVPTIKRPYQQCLDSIEASLPLLEAAGWDHYMVNEVGNPYISAARATMLRKALDAGADAIVFIDHDLGWKPADLVTLANAPGDVVAGTYRFKADEESYMGSLLLDHGQGFMSAKQGNGQPSGRVSDDGIFQLRAQTVPAGFLKVTPAAVELFMGAYPHLCYGEKWRQSVDLFNHGAHKGLWWGEDYAFCRNYTEAGGEIWLIPTLDLAHYGAGADGAVKAYPGNFHEFMQRQPGGAKDPAKRFAPSAPAQPEDGGRFP